MNKVRPRDCPSLGNPRKWDRSFGRKIEVVGSAEGEVGKEFEVSHAVGTELEVGSGHAVCWCSLQRFEVVELD